MRLIKFCLTLTGGVLFKTNRILNVVFENKKVFAKFASQIFFLGGEIRCVLYVLIVLNSLLKSENEKFSVVVWRLFFLFFETEKKELIIAVAGWMLSFSSCLERL
jgi:hypothetical protein